MKISVIVPAYNEAKLIGDSLACIRSAMGAFTSRGWESELIVCDNNSTDATPEIARAAGAKVVFDPINMISRARNTGASVATGDWYLFIDADDRPTRELLADCADAIETGRCLGGGVTLHFPGEKSWRAHIAGRIWNRISRVMTICGGYFIFVEARAFREIGGFDTRLYIGEDLDIAKRLKALGRTRNQKLVILHRHPIITSARKVYLYSGMELVRFFYRATVARKRTFTDPNWCHIWYDGRR